jgi:Ran GTPase-activating protein (RanGAP) involved in mRNA processing and transport
MTHQVAQAIGSWLAQNKSLVKLYWNAIQGAQFTEEVLFGLCDNTSLKILTLAAQLTKLSSQALRSLLHFNGTLEGLALTLLKDDEIALTQLKYHQKIPAIVSVLAGLAKNTGLKKLRFKTASGGTNATLATAWTNMLQRNTSITSFDLREAFGDKNARYELCTAVAEGLVENSTLETLYLPCMEYRTDFHGPVWQEALQSNHSLKMLSFRECSIPLRSHECLAQGISRNTSLESLDLSYTDMTDASIIALVDGLRTNKTLKCLNLSDNSDLNQSGRAAIERLIGYNVLRELFLAGTAESVGASILASGLSDNHSLERLDLEGALVDGARSETFRALCASLHGNTTLRELDVRCNGVVLDDVCATALKLDTMALETLDLDLNGVTSCGITALAQRLQGPCTLKELSLTSCGLNDTDLLKLGEALTSNGALEVLDVSNNDFTHYGVSHFFELLPQMKGLKAVHGLVDLRNGWLGIGCRYPRKYKVTKDIRGR